MIDNCDVCDVCDLPQETCDLIHAVVSVVFCAQRGWFISARAHWITVWQILGYPRTHP